MAIKELDINLWADRENIEYLEIDILLPADIGNTSEKANIFDSVKTYVLLFLAAFALYGLSANYTLDDYDSINFAMAVEYYDLSNDAPHPPGAPIYIALAKTINYLLNDIALTLTLTAALGGAFFVIVWHMIFKQIMPIKTATIGTIILATSPGLWMTASRPMSDTVAAAVLSVVVLMSMNYAISRRSNLLIYLGAVLALLVGIRPQFGLLAPFLLFTTLLYFRPKLKTSLAACALFVLLNCCWLLPTIASQYNLDGDGWMTYYNQILRFKENFDTASGSPLLANNFQLSDIFLRAATHLGTLGYFALGLNLWYPESIAVLLENFGTALNPWYKDKVEWTYAGSFYAAFYIFACLALIPRALYHWKKTQLVSEAAGCLLLMAIAYAIMVIMLVPPHMRFYIPLLPVFILLPLMGLQSRRWGHRFQYLFMVSAIFAALPTVVDSITQESPSIALVNEVQKRTNERGKDTVLLLNSNASRHAKWYMPEAIIYGSRGEKAPSEPHGLFAPGIRVFANYPDAFPQMLVDEEPLGSFHRPFRVWMRHASTQLFELRLRPLALAEDNSVEAEPSIKAMDENNLSNESQLSAAVRNLPQITTDEL